MATAVTNSSRSSWPTRKKQVAHCGFEIGAIGDFVGHDPELAADRIGKLAPDHRNCDRHRMAGAQAAHDHVNGIGKLLAELL